MAKWWEGIGDKKISPVNENFEKNLLTAEGGTDIVSSYDGMANGGTAPESSSKPPPATKEKQMSDKAAVTMEDGRIVEFTAKQKMLKDTTIGEDGSIVTRLDFRNGKSLQFIMPDSLKDRFAAHGADQKLGDAIAGVKEIDDAVLSVESLIKQLTAGEWSSKRESGGFAGTSILLRALCKMSGKSPEEIKVFLEGKTQAEKLALRNNPRVQPFIKELEADKTSDVDTESMLDELN